MLPNATVRCAVRNSRSFEDLALLPLLLAAAGPQRTGTFVELGGFTGEEGSQTWLLEKCFGWTGTLIEASPINFAAMQRAGRSARLVHAGVCRPAGQFTVAVGDSPCSVTGDVEFMTASFRRTFGMHHRRNTTVPCRPLMDLLADDASQEATGIGPPEKYSGHHRPATLPRRTRLELGHQRSAMDVTFLSLDVEGAEEVVLRTIRTAPRFPFSVVLVEMNREAGLQLTNSTRHVLNLLKRAGLKQLPIGKVAGSDNALFARPELGDPRLTIEPPQDAVAQVRRAVAASRPLSRYSAVPLSYMGGPVAFAKRAALGLLRAETRMHKFV